MTTRRLTRRRVLQGAGGFTLALPFLPSLQPRDASAGGLLGPPRRFVAIVNQHGGSWESRFYPADSATTETMQYAGHTIRRGDLPRSVDGGVASISPVLSAPATDLGEALAGKMNVLRGLDSIIHVGHNRGSALGNPNDTDDADTAAQTTARPTIDQVLAYSDHFYGDLSTNLMRSMLIDHTQSAGWSNPEAQSGSIERLPTEGNPQYLFDQIFVPGEKETEEPRPLVVDRVIDHYHALRDGNRRLSAADRVRLDEHIARIDELQRKLSVVVDCGDVAPPADPGGQPWTPQFDHNPAMHREWSAAMNDVIAAAFLCDTSRIAVIGVSGLTNFSDYAGDWHQDIAHMAERSEAPPELPGLTDLPQNIISDAYQQTFEHVFLDLIRKLDVDDGTGATVLDGSLVMWTQESGPWTHECTNIPVVTAGSAGGELATGQVIDYRNLNRPYEDLQYGGSIAPNGETLYMGLTWNQLLGTVLQSMGLPPDAYEESPGIGYGEPTPTSFRDPLYPQSVLNAMGEQLPWLTR